MESSHDEADPTDPDVAVGGIAVVARARPGSERRVLFVNDQWGYGSVTMAMAISDELQHWTGFFAGQGPGFELARRSTFNGLVHADTRAEIVPDRLQMLLDSSQVVVSVMNGQIAWRAAQKGIPCLYVDCLTWMWPEPPSVPPGVRYIAESFPGAEANLAAWRGSIQDSKLVGPIVCQPAGRRHSYRDAVLVNFGGLSNWLNGKESLAAYAQTMAECAASALSERGWDGRVVVGAGQHVLDRMDERSLRARHPRVELVDLSHDAYLAELRRSAVLFSSAGMHAFYEACSEEVPCVCLPSQNVSGTLALRVLERSGVAGHKVDWDDLYGPVDLDPAHEAESCRQIDERIMRFQNDQQARKALTMHLAASFDESALGDLQRRQAAFYLAQGERGARRIAEQVNRLVVAETVSLAGC